MILLVRPCLLWATLAAIGTVLFCEGHSFNSYPYLYFTENDKNASFPVVDHIPPKGERALENDRPAFLYIPPPGEYRVVEFYVHWCDICRHFRKYYIQYARTVLRIAAERQPGAKISFHAVSCVPNKALCQKQAVTGYPLLKLFKPGQVDNAVSMRHMEAKPLVMLESMGFNVTGLESDAVDVDEIEEGSERDGVEPWWSTWYNYIQGIDAAANPGSNVMFRRTREDLRNDIHLSFDFAMRNNVYLVGANKLSAEAKTALNDYFVLLRNTLPPSWKDLHALLEELIRNIRYVTKKEPYLIKFLDKYPPKSLEEGGEPVWSESCSRGEPGRGFTCGLWETFHAVTVGLVRYNKNQLVDQTLLTTDSVANTMRRFVEHFFTCEECREHFLKMYDKCEFKRCDRLKKKTKLSGDHVSDLEWQQLPLWLYEVHNSVNVRLMKEKAKREKRKTTRQDEEDVQWPSLRDCNPCWLKPKRGPRKWNETVVFSYLQLEYGQRDASVSEFQKQLLEANLAAVDSDVQRLQSSGPNVATSAMFHPLVFVALILGYACFGARGNACIRRIFTRKKVRTV